MYLAPLRCGVASLCWTGASFEKMATECGFNSWYITSAKTDHNITEGMHFLIQEILAVGEEAQNAL
jgi:hypothetical protein